jgi:hypothetical protein
VEGGTAAVAHRRRDPSGLRRAGEGRAGVVTRVPELEASQQRAAELTDTGEYAEALRRGYDYLPEQARDARRQDAVREYLAEVRAVLALLADPDDAELAGHTRRHAVEEVSWGHLRDEVAEALEG